MLRAYVRANFPGIVAQKSAAPMIVRCECGWEARGTLAELVPVVQKHGLEAHNMKVTRAGVAAKAKPL